MDLRRLTSRAKDMFAKRGGKEAAKQDAQELKDIARSEGSLGDKAKAGFEALKEPGGPGEERRPGGEEPRPSGEQRSTGEERRPSGEQPSTGEEPRPGGEQPRPGGEETRPRP
jgi:hypothetical protein